MRNAECYKYKVAKTQGTQMPDGTEAAWWYKEYTVPHEAAPTFVCPELDHHCFIGTMAPSSPWAHASLDAMTFDRHREHVLR